MGALHRLLVAALALAAASAASAQTPRPAAPDVLPDVVVRATPAPDKIDVMLDRIPRLRRCFVPDTWSRDPSAKFNQAYYEELTGQADYYDKIRLPPPKVVFRYPGAIHAGENMFRNLDMTMAGTMPETVLGYQRPARRVSVDQAASCPGRDKMERDPNLARALAMLDKGEYARALPTLEQAYARLRRSPMGGEVALMIAGMYMRGEGAARDTPKAIAWLEKAYDGVIVGRKNKPLRYNPDTPDRFYDTPTEAATSLSLIYLNGNGVPKDEAAARQWVERAMRGGHVPAAKAAADMYYAGYGGPKNLRTALMTYEGAGEMRHAGALFAAAEMRDFGEGGNADRKKAVRLYAMAGQLGSMPATHALAVAYDKGDGVPTDPERALALYKIAAVGGNGPAQTAIGVYFYEGGSVLGKDLVQARAWFGEAAQRGDPDGMVNLAAMLIKGEGGEVDLVKAYAWLYIAADGGREDARAGLKSLEGRMTAADLASVKALLAG